MKYKEVEIKEKMWKKRKCEKIAFRFLFLSPCTCYVFARNVELSISACIIIVISMYDIVDHCHIDDDILQKDSISCNELCLLAPILQGWIDHEDVDLSVARWVVIAFTCLPG